MRTFKYPSLFFSQMQQWLRYRTALRLLRQLASHELADLRLSPGELSNLARKVCRVRRQ